MKAEHRKELETNALAYYLGTALNYAKEGPSQKVLLYSGLVALVVAVGVAFWWFSTRSKDIDAVRWEQYNALSLGTKEPATEDEIKAIYTEYLNVSKEAQEGDPRDKLSYTVYTSENRAFLDRLVQIDKFEKANSGTVQARLARFMKARHLLDKSSDLASSGFRVQMAEKWTSKAAEVYDKLIDEAGGEAALAEEALYNSGKAYEIRNDVEKAKQKYDRLKKDYPKSMYVADADKALARLKDTKDLEMLKTLTAAQ